MESSSTSRWESTTRLKLSSEEGIGRQALITSAKRELVEFYWTKRKRFWGLLTLSLKSKQRSLEIKRNKDLIYNFIVILQI